MFAFAIIMCVLGSIGILLFVIMLARKICKGCISIILFIHLAGAIIMIHVGGNDFIYENYEAPGMAIYNIVGIILGIIGGKFLRDDIAVNRSYNSGASSSYSSSSSSRFSAADHVANRQNYPNKCISCTYYLSRGVCRQSSKTVSEMDSCSNWC